MDKEYKESEQLQKVLSEVLKHTGIDIKTPEDLKAFEDHIEFKIDKHRENYPEKTKEEIEREKKNQRSVIEIIYSYFNYLGEDFDEDMRLIVFIQAIKKIAEDRINKAQIHKENG